MVEVTLARLQPELLMRMCLNSMARTHSDSLAGGFNIFQWSDTENHDVNTSIGSSTLPTPGIALGHWSCRCSPYRNRLSLSYTVAVQSCKAVHSHMGQVQAYVQNVPCMQR